MNINKFLKCNNSTNVIAAATGKDLVYYIKNIKAFIRR